jgi:hypothetical protein
VSVILLGGPDMEARRVLLTDKSDRIVCVTTVWFARNPDGKLRAVLAAETLTGIVPEIQVACPPCDEVNSAFWKPAKRLLLPWL